MDFLYNNKFLFSLIIAIILGVVYYKFSKVNKENESQNKDMALYITGGVFAVLFGILYMTQESSDDVFSNIKTGETPF